jgi:opacity protein-like surface antigen
MIWGLNFFTLNHAQAQFFRGIGITAGVTMSKQKWFLSETTDTGFTSIITPAIIKQKNIFGFNASLRGEFINNDNIRWVTELQFNQKGCRDKVFSSNGVTHLNYISWNNFLKVQYETFEGYPYILLGPRIEYTLSQASQSPAVSRSFNKINFSWGVGAGFEKIVFSNLKPFIELHWNPDTPFYYAYQDEPLRIRNRAWELRLGIIYRPGGKDECPSVVY